MKRCIVIGGGLAGLAAAVFLIKKSVKVTLIESSPKLGGRAYSYYDHKYGHFVDNGQHIMMGCYKSTLEFLDIINANDQIVLQNTLRVPFINKNGKIFPLDANRGFYPFNLTYAVMNYKMLSSQEKLSIFKFFMNFILFDAGESEKHNVLEWLRKGGQSLNAVESLWKILCVGALNSEPEAASAGLFRDILREIFLKGKDNNRIILTRNSLNETFSEKARLYIIQNGGEIKISERACSMEINNGTINLLSTTKQTYKDFDFVITAAPVTALRKINFVPVMPRFYLPEMEYSPILSVHLWGQTGIFTERFYGFTDSPVHWLFNNKTHITLVTSAADNMIKLPNDEIIKIFTQEIKNRFPDFDTGKITDVQVLKEKSATFIPTSASNHERKKTYNPIKNLAFAGDWTDTKLPATIEGAIKSGKTAVDLLLNA